MAVRRLNYTGRRRLRQVDTRITVFDPDGGAAAWFTADLSLQDYGLPDDAQVFVEAQRQTSFMRFRYGTVSSPRPQDDLILKEFDSPEGVLFRVKVTSRQDRAGVILAEADRIRPRRPLLQEERRIPLLPVKSDSSLGSQVCRIDFGDRPILLVNAALGDWRAVALNPVFISLVYPAALREILNRVLRVERRFETDDEDWPSQWLRFATLLPGTPQPPSETDEDHFDDWIDEAVSAFCRRFGIMRRFEQYWTEEGTS